MFKHRQFFPSIHFVFFSNRLEKKRISKINGFFRILICAPVFMIAKKKNKLKNNDVTFDEIFATTEPYQVYIKTSSYNIN